MDKTTRLLSGGNPQIAKGDGDAPVLAWIAALPGWKGEVAAGLDGLIGREVPGVRRAVKWNSPLYGAGEGWFMGLHAFDRYLKLAFFRGDMLQPVPPVASKTAGTRYFHIREGEILDEVVLAGWVRQAAGLAGVKL